MENNKLLIGIQFLDKDENGKEHSDIIELYVTRDISFRQLLDGVRYGLEKKIRENDRYKNIYQRCLAIYNKSSSENSQIVREGDIKFLNNILLTSFNISGAKDYVMEGKRNCISRDAYAVPICDLGIITSSKIIFDATGKYEPTGTVATSHIQDPFNPKKSRELFYPEYNRSTRLLYKFDDSEVAVIPPTAPPAKNSGGLLSLILPSLFSALVMMAARYYGSGGYMSSPVMLLTYGATTAVGITMTLINFFKQKNEYGSQLAKWKSRYESYINDLISQIRSRQKEDRDKLINLYPDADSLMKVKTDTLSSEIYSRTHDDEDFLTFRLGVSDDVPSMFEIKGQEHEEVFSEAFFTLENGEIRLHLRDELRDDQAAYNLNSLPAFISEKYRYLNDAPLLYSLKNKRVLGLVDKNINEYGILSRAHYFISRMIYELCYYHSPDDLQFVVFFDNKAEWNDIENEIMFYKFLPHFRGLFDDKSQFVFDDNSASAVMSNLLSIMNERRPDEDNHPSTLPHIVLVVFNEHKLKEHALAQYLPDSALSQDEANLGLTFVFAKKYKEYLPVYCDDVIELNDVSSLIPHDDVMNRKSFSFLYKSYTSNFKNYSEDRLSATNFLSSIYYSKIAQNGKVPSSVNMFSIIGCKKDNVDTKIIKNWGLNGDRTTDSITESLKVAIGRTEADDAYLDLHEKADGPHMLVAGTTGSGKTETIISYLLALCMKFRPDELNLLLVDMKGGGFTQRLGNLPHVVGMVTDVDGYESGMGSAYMLNRFLYALKAEIDRRKHLLKKMHVDSIDGYISACSSIDAHITRKNIKGDEARELRNLAVNEKLTHLILVVDEFTELKRFSSENNDVDFIGEITTIARIGRSLGLHIILISQNIEGAITDDIRVNSNSRLCLKVATKQASREMIGNDLAASPYMPGHGRGYLLVGTGSKFDYFQSAYSGTDVDEIASIDITLASKNGLYESFYSSERDNTEFIDKKKQREKEGKAKSQLELIVESICKVNKEENGDYKPHIIFNAPLQKELRLSGCKDSPQKNLLAMGLYDAPQIQQQPVFYLDLYRSNVAVFGQPMSGKTGFIKTMLTRMHQKAALVPEENVYIIDFGGNMGDYADLPYVCACFDKSNEENIRRIFYSVEERVKSNSVALGSRNYYAQYQKDPKVCPPHITLIIENINALLLDDRYETYKERLLLLCRDGLSKGLTIVFTANDTASLANYLTNFGQRVAFEMPENSYGDIFSGKVNAVMRSAGRGIINKDGETYEFQCCLPYDLSEEDELKKLRAGIKGYENKHRLISFGNELNAGNFRQYSEGSVPYVNSDYSIITGLDYYEHKVVSVDMIKDRVITIYGKRQFGKTNLLKLLMKGILDNDDQTQFIYFDDGRKELEQFYRVTADRSIMFRSLDDFYKYLQQIPGMPSKPDPAYNPPRKLTDDHPIVFVLQSKMLYAEDPKSNAIMTSFLPKLISEEEKLKYMFIFTDTRRSTHAETNAMLSNHSSVAFLLDNIGEFIVDKGNRTVFADFDAKEMKARYATCQIGDGYYYHVEADKLLKTKFIHMPDDFSKEVRK